MFEKFLERSGNSIKLEEFSEDYIRQYNNLVSEKLISFWRIAGIGIIVMACLELLYRMTISIL